MATETPHTDRCWWVHMYVVYKRAIGQPKKKKSNNREQCGIDNGDFQLLGKESDRDDDRDHCVSERTIELTGCSIDYISFSALFIT